MLYDHHTSFIPFCLACLCCTSYRKLYWHSCLWRFMETTWKFKQWLRCTIGPSTSTLTAQVPHVCLSRNCPQLNNINGILPTLSQPTRSQLVMFIGIRTLNCIVHSCFMCRTHQYLPWELWDWLATHPAQLSSQQSLQFSFGSM
jgi:hypothetical protein